MDEQRKPIKTFRDGAAGASVWLKETEAGSYYDIAFTRSWKNDETGKSGYSHTFGDRHLDLLIHVALQVREWIVAQKEETLSADSDKKAA